MPVTIQVDITIRPDMVSEFTELIHKDRETALKSECIFSFDIMTDSSEPNKFTLLETVSSKNALLQHMKTSHYRWSEFMKTGAVLAYKHTYI